MGSLHPARRSAERFSSLLDGEQGALYDARTTELLELVGALQTLPRVEARPEFVSDLRTQLMAAAETELSPLAEHEARELSERLTVPTRRTPRERRLAVAIGGFAIVGATTSMAVAAQGALPGDVLYPLKRAIENAEAGFNISDESKGNTILANATGRLDEVDALTQLDDVDPVAVTETLNTFTTQATEASDLLIADYQATGSEASINELRDFAASSIETLAALEALIPADAEDALIEAARVLFEIDSVAANLCPVCESTGIISIPISLLAGDSNGLDAAQVGVAANESTPTKTKSKPKSSQTGTGTGTGETSTTDSPSNPVILPNPGGSGSQGDKGDKGEKNPLPPISIPTTLPSTNLGPVDDLVSGLTKGTNDVIGGLTGQD
ncbi:DUF5667 domain-containing protein [Nocardioides sp.]|uniref:DUF5667 domain-containing protein n=1 Tax=Nocardioides sp. TaxID=35761 RepID=UPI0035650FBE